jgi:hypothetical protein
MTYQRLYIDSTWKMPHLRSVQAALLNSTSERLGLIDEHDAGDQPKIKEVQLVDL